MCENMLPKFVKKISWQCEFGTFYFRLYLSFIRFSFIEIIN